MEFNPDKTNRPYKLSFPRKKCSYPPNRGSEVAVKTEHKHLGMILDSKLNFQSHIREAIIKARRGIGIIPFLSKYVSRDILDQIYKLYVRPHLDYGDSFITNTPPTTGISNVPSSTCLGLKLHTFKVRKKSSLPEVKFQTLPEPLLNKNI